jgi:hypothetical protein
VDNALYRRIEGEMKLESSKSEAGAKTEKMPNPEKSKIT